MPENCYRNICQNKDVRQNLIELKKCLDEESARRKFAYMLGGDFRVFYRLLENEDPKVRKNAALILGMMETEDVLPALFDAWETEQTRFVRTAYLKAMQKLDYRPYLSKLRDRVKVLEEMDIEPDEAKHVREELRQLQQLLLPYQKRARHRFKDEETLSDVLLVANRAMLDCLEEQAEGEQKKQVGSALRISGARAAQLMQIRYWQEMLFVIPGAGVLRGSAEKIGASLAALHIEDLLDRLHEGDGDWAYRMELRGVDKTFDKGSFIRTVSGELDRRSAGRLVNASSGYEAEIRLIMRKDGTYLPFVKLYTLPDERFRYRREYVADSITPVNAAAVIAAARPYLTEGAQVLDPFCGVGTLLTERMYAMRTGSAYGVDLFGEAIEKARQNAARAKMPINYVHRDFFTFQHAYVFDEVITDLPRTKAESGVREEQVAEQMLEALPGLLAPKAVVVIYTFKLKEVAASIRRRAEYHLEKEVVFNAKSGIGMLVARYQK